jgi:hypothetical protein
MGQLRESIKALEHSLVLSDKVGNSHGDVETFGALGDMCSQLGNLEDAGKVRFMRTCRRLFYLPSISLYCSNVYACAACCLGLLT